MDIGETRRMKQKQAQLEAEVKKWGEILKTFPKNSIGITTAEARALPEWQNAKKNRDEAFNRLRQFNQQFAREIHIHA